ncbi:MAG: transcription antitermination factor NusB [Actinobacteria bacterium]|nr:transcription antitermination factor NusB [Actinomycetota bacterium]
MVKITRRKSREAAVILLYQSDLLGKDSEEVLKNEIDFGKKIDEFASGLVKGVNKNREAIDKEIIGVVENWTIERIAIIDRNILRVAIYEMLFEKDIPLKVSIDEAIEIAKSLGQKDDTPKFINGILGKILTNIGEKLI